MKELLLQLCAPAGVSGAEKPAAQEAAEALSAFAQVHTDASGNVIGEIAGHGPHILLDAHIDQVGMVVTGVDAEGFLRIDKCGGIDIRTLAGHEVTVWGERAALRRGVQHASASLQAGGSVNYRYHGNGD